MKILHIITAPAAGGAEMYIKDLAKSLLSQGHSVHIGFLGKAGDIGRSQDFERSFLTELADAGVKFFFIGSASRSFPWLGALRVRRYVKEENIDIYHAHLSYGIVFGSLIRIPRIYTHHNAKMRVSRSVFNILKIWIDELVAISSLCGRALSEFSGRDVTVIRNGIDLTKIIRKQVIVDRPAQLIRCVAVGGITKQKNYNLLVAAVERIPAGVRSRLLISIAGEGPQAETYELRKAVQKTGLGDLIELLGNVDDIPALLNQSDLFLMSSAWEGLPIALIEATSSGLPCIVSDVGGCREVIDTCKNGLVVGPDNAQALADAIECLVKTPARLTEYSDNALKYSSEFSIERACEGHLALYAKLLSNRLSLAVSHTKQDVPRLIA